MTDTKNIKSNKNKNKIRIIVKSIHSSFHFESINNSILKYSPGIGTVIRI